MAGRPKKYTDDYLSDLVESLWDYIDTTEVPILKEWCVSEGVPSKHVYDYEPFADPIRALIKKSGKSNTRKYDYDTSSGEYPALAKYRQCPEYRIRVCLTARMRDCIRRRIRGAGSVSGIVSNLPYTVDELMAHLEGQFKPGMTWDNYGSWHIDHIRPLSSFGYSSTDDPEFFEAWSLGNLQPLWAADNIRKGARVA